MLATTWLGVRITQFDGGIAPIWPVNAIVVAAMVKSPSRRWTWLIGLALVGNILGNRIGGNSLSLSLSLSIFNSAEYAFCGFALARLLRNSPDFTGRRELWNFALLCLGASIVAALATSSLFKVYSRPDAAAALAVWALSDGLGLLIVTPVLLSGFSPALRAAFSPPRAWRNLAMSAGFAAVIALLFCQSRYGLLFLAPGALLILVFELGAAGCAIGLCLTTVISVGLSITGHGPVAMTATPRLETVLALQAFLAGSAIVTLAVTATLTQGRRYAEALGESEARYRMLADKATDVIVRYDPKGVIEYISPAIRHYGYNPAALIGRNMADFVHPSEYDQTLSVRTAVTRGQVLPLTETHAFRARRADGSWVWMQGNPSPITDDGGRVVGAVSVLRDITASKAAEEALAASEAKYRLLAENATDVTACCRKNGELTYLSPSVRRVFGYEPEELVGTNSIELIHPEDRDAVAEKLRALIAAGPSGGAMRIEYRFRKKDGAYTWVEANPSLRTDPVTGAVVELQDCVRDISARKALEAELKHKQVEAEAAAVAKSEFLANMSHEIRTPLTAIIGFGALLETVEGLPAKARAFLTRIATASQTLLLVVNDVLDFSKVDAGQVELDEHAFDPTEFVADTLALVASQAAAKGLTLDCNAAGALPKAVRADSARLRQVLLNLLTNAIKFTERGGVTVEVAYSGLAGGSLMFEVIDTGVGVPPELSHRLFQRFSQVDGSTTRQYGGTGLGLAICKGLVELMGGEIGLASQLGQGSTFWFTVVAPIADHADTPAPEARTDWAVGPLRILVVDDVEMNRELVGAMLSPFDIALNEASGGAEAVAAAQRDAYDLILMDLQMPGMDGLAATRAIRAQSDLNRSTPILALSANVLPTHVAACREAGMDDHISKPIRADELLGKIAFWTDPAAAHGRAATGGAQEPMGLADR